MSKEVRKKKHAIIVNIHIRSPFYVMYFYLYNYNSPLQLYRTSNIHLCVCPNATDAEVRRGWYRPVNG